MTLTFGNELNLELMKPCSLLRSSSILMPASGCSAPPLRSRVQEARKGRDDEDDPVAIHGNHPLETGD